MFPVGGFEVNRDRLLISSAMLTSLNESNCTDNLKLIEPFVQVCLASTTNVSEIINKAKVLEKLKQDFALTDMPVAVLDKILRRLSKHTPSSERIIKYENGDYYFVKNPKEQVDSFCKIERNANEQIEYVIKELGLWFNIHAPQLKYTESDLIKHLSLFFESKGLDILFEFDAIRSTTYTNTDRINYQIGRFIVDAKESNSKLFESILNIVQGMMIASAIYIDTNPVSPFVERRGLNGIDVFVDTTLVIYAMGYKTQAQEDAAYYLINALYNRGANLLIFQQHFQEIKDIMFAFSNRDSSKTSFQTLERLESQSWSLSEIKTEIEFLESRLKDKLNIKVYRGNLYTQNDGKLFDADGAYIDSEQLKASIKNKIPGYRRDDMVLQNDIDAVSSVIAKRDGMRFARLETCMSLFVTTNYSLVHECNRFLGYSSHKQDIPPIISDVDLTTIVWLKYGCADPNVPRLMLARHATAAITPTDAVLENFFRIVQNMEKRGGISSDEAAYLRYDIYTRSEIMQMCEGDPECITEGNVCDILNRLKNRYTQDAQEETIQAKLQLEEERCKIDTLQKAYAKELNKITARVRVAENHESESSKQLRVFQTRNTDARESLLTNADKKAKKKANRIAGIFHILLIGVLLAIFAICAYDTVKGIINCRTAILYIVSVWGLASQFIPALDILSKIEFLVKTKLFDFFYSREYREIEPQLKILRGESEME